MNPQQTEIDQLTHQLWSLPVIYGEYTDDTKALCHAEVLLGRIVELRRQLTH